MKRAGNDSKSVVRRPGLLSSQQGGSRFGRFWNPVPILPIRDPPDPRLPCELE